jgi:hypothetical protein
MKGNQEEAKQSNSLLDAFRVKLNDYQREILTEGKPFCSETLKNKWFGIVR